LGLAGTNFFYLAVQQGAGGGLDLPSIDFPYLGTRGIIGIVVLIHMFFAQLFIGYIIGSPILQAWGARKGNERMQRLSKALDKFNVLTFSVGATFAGMFLVLLVGFYPRVTSALFTHFFWFFPVMAMTAMVLTLYLLYVYHYRTKRQSLLVGLGAAFFILVWQTILTGVDTYMVTGGGAGANTVQSGGDLNNLGSALGDMFSLLSISLDLHRTFGNLSWPAFAVAGWAGFRYHWAKSPEDKAFYDWAGSMGVLWGTIFLLFQPFVGFVNVLSLKLLDYNSGNVSAPGASGPYNRLVGSGSDTWTSHLLYINLLMVVALFVLSNAAMYMGAMSHPEREGRRSIQLLGLIAVVAGLYSVSPIAGFPVFWVRYVAMLIMVLATVGALVSYARARRAFDYGSPGGGYRAVLMLLGVAAVLVTLNMGYMKSNSRAPYTIYGQDNYQVSPEKPFKQSVLQPRSDPGNGKVP